MSKLRETIKIANRLLNVRVPYRKNSESKEILQSILTLDGSILAFLDQVFWHVDIDALSDDDMRTVCATYKRVTDEEDIKYEVDTDYFLSLSDDQLAIANQCLKKIHDSLKEIEGIVKIEKDTSTKEEKVTYTASKDDYEEFEDSEIYKFMLCRLTGDSKIMSNPVLRLLIEKECRRLKMPIMNMMSMMSNVSMDSGPSSSNGSTTNSNSAMEQMVRMQIMRQMMGGEKFDPNDMMKMQMMQNMMSSDNDSALESMMKMQMMTTMMLPF